jgi:lysophospholipase L1-like esterase
MLPRISNFCHIQDRKRALFHFAIAVLLSCQGIWVTAPAFAAEKLAVRYGLFEATVSIADLQTYGSTRQTSSVLQGFLNYLPDRQAEFQSLLQTRIPVDVVALDRVLNGAVGQVFLKQVAGAIARPDNAGIPALRSAFILGARDPHGLSILSFLVAYPSPKFVLDLPKAIVLVRQSIPTPPTDRLASIPAWQTLVEYQATVSQKKQYQGCLFGDSISSALGHSLGAGRFNFAVGGMSTTSLLTQLQWLVEKNVQCHSAIVAIGTNDALYTIENGQFKENLTEIIRLVRSLGTERIVLLPAFYSTVAASKNPQMAGSIPRVNEINQLLSEVAKAENVPVNVAAIQPLFEQQALKANLTRDGVHLNAAGLSIYRKALLNIFTAEPVGTKP